MALFFHLSWYCAIAVYAVLAWRLVALRLYSQYRVLLAVCIFQIVSGLALLPFSPSSPQYARAWVWVQTGVIFFNIVVAADVALKSGEGFPLLTRGTIGMLVVLLCISAVLTLYSRGLDDTVFTFSRPVVATVLIKRHVDLALGIWGFLVGVFYATAAARGERPNVQRYRWAMIAFFTLQCAFYLVIQWNHRRGMELYSALALLPTMLIFGWLAWSLSATGNVFIPARTRLSGLSTAELKDLYSGRPHGDTHSH